ncbi:PrgI family protein [Patescibacteria group bacterium]|nr:PrgI family protein [Patescibacteria group bacterium]MBU4580383.1 PrgI family protein [Patescibacteria group bacterium]
MQFPIPQFIDVEDTVVGPLTVKQTVILGIGAMLIFMSSLIFVGFIAVLIALPTIIASVLLAFYKPNGRPLYVLIANYFTYIFKPKLYIWRREPQGVLIKRAIRKETLKDNVSAEYKIISRNRLQELAWILDTQQAVAPEGDEGIRESV